MDSCLLQFFSEKANGAKDADFYGVFRDAEGVGDLAVRFFFDEGEKDDHAEARGKRCDGAVNRAAGFGGDEMVRLAGSGEIVRQGIFAAGLAKIIDGGVGGDAASPRGEIAFCGEAGVRAMDAPESFHG